MIDPTNHYPWSMEDRADYGHQVIDVAPTVDRHPCHTAWYAYPHQLAQPGMVYTDSLRQLLKRMTCAGILQQSGGARTCRRACRGIPLAWYAAVGVDPTHTHVEPLHWRLAVDRHDAHEQWSEVTTRRYWWTGAGVAR